MQDEGLKQQERCRVKNTADVLNVTLREESALSARVEALG
jgi:hypothetical protein